MMLSLDINEITVPVHKTATYSSFVNVWTTSSEVRLTFFQQHFQPLYYVVRKEFELEFFQSMNFDFVASLKNNGTNCLLIFLKISIACQNFCPPVDDIHHRLDTSYKKHKFFLQTKPGREFQLQYTHIVLIKSIRDVMPLYVKFTLGPWTGAGWLGSRQKASYFVIFWVLCSN